jgi:hypothetical protein
MNLVSSILQMATPVIIDRVAAALGINSALARTAINFALPAILGAFASKAATPAGAQGLMSAVSSADSGLFGNLESMLGGSGKDALVNNGTQMLNKVLGGGEVSSLTNALASKTGLGAGAAAMLLPIVGQMAVSGIAKAAPGVDASGLAKMLASQTGNMGASVSDAARSATAAMPSAPAAPGGGFLKWLVPLAVLAAALWYFLGSAPKNVSDMAKDTAATTTAAVPAALTVDGVDISKTVTDSLGTLTTTIGTITNAETATAALPKIAEVTKSIDGLSAVTSKLTADQKGMLGTLITAGLPAVKAAADKVLADAGIAAIAKPVLDTVFGKIEALAK